MSLGRDEGGWGSIFLLKKLKLDFSPLEIGGWDDDRRGVTGTLPSGLAGSKTGPDFTPGPVLLNFRRG